VGWDSEDERERENETNVEGGMESSGLSSLSMYV
jgi:hypothetical protein